MAGYRGFKRFKGSWIALRAMNFICHFAAVVGAFKIKGRLFFIKPHNRADSAKENKPTGPSARWKCIPPYPAAPDFHLKVKRLTMICALLALLHPLLSLTHWIFGSLMLPYKSSSHSAKYARWCDSCSLATPMQGAELNTARQSSHKSPARDDDVGEHQWTHLRCEGSKGS